MREPTTLKGISTSSTQAETFNTQDAASLSAMFSGLV
jgi:hypothetical protein